MLSLYHGFVGKLGIFVMSRERTSFVDIAKKAAKKITPPTMRKKLEQEELHPFEKRPLTEEEIEHKETQASITQAWQNYIPELIKVCKANQGIIDVYKTFLKRLNEETEDGRVLTAKEIGIRRTRILTAALREHPDFIEPFYDKNDNIKKLFPTANTLLESIFQEVKLQQIEYILLHIDSLIDKPDEKKTSHDKKDKIKTKERKEQEEFSFASRMFLCTLPSSFNKMGTFIKESGDEMPRISNELLEEIKLLEIDITPEQVMDICRKLFAIGLGMALNSPDELAGLIASDLKKTPDNTTKQLSLECYKKIARFSEENEEIFPKYQAFLESYLIQKLCPVSILLERTKAFQKARINTSYLCSHEESEANKLELLNYLVKSPNSQFYIERAITSSSSDLEALSRNLHECLTDKEIEITLEQTIIICRKISLIGCSVMLAFPEAIVPLIENDLKGENRTILSPESCNKIAALARCNIPVYETFLDNVFAKKQMLTEQEIDERKQQIEKAVSKLNYFFPEESFKSREEQSENAIRRTGSVEDNLGKIINITTLSNTAILEGAISTWINGGISKEKTRNISQDSLSRSSSGHSIL